MVRKRSAPGQGADHRTAAIENEPSGAAAHTRSRETPETGCTHDIARPDGLSNRLPPSGEVLWETVETIRGFQVTTRAIAASPAQNEVRRRWITDMLLGCGQVTGNSD